MMWFRKRPKWRDLERLADLIELLIDCHPQGFGVLLGAVPPPSGEQIHAMMDAKRGCEDAGVPSSSPKLTVRAERIVWDEEFYEETVKRAWGWPHITRICREHREYDPGLWDIVMDHAKYVTASSSRLTRRLEKVAKRHHVSPQTVMKYHREFPKELASVILTPPADWSGPGLPVE